MRKRAQGGRKEEIPKRRKGRWKKRKEKTGGKGAENKESEERREVRTERRGMRL